MSSPVQQVNNFVLPEKNNIDFVSKCVLYMECTFGVHQISVLNITNKRSIRLLRCYHIVLNLCLILVYIFSPFNLMFFFLGFIDLLRFLLSTLLGNIFHRRLYMFFYELNKFDEQIRLNNSEKITKATYLIQLFLVFITGVFFIFLIYTNNDHLMTSFFVWCLFTYHILELYCFGHLFSLILRRIKLITKHLKLSCPKPQSRQFFYTNYLQKMEGLKKKQNKSLSYFDLQKVTYMYNEMIIIHDCLNNAIKWQLIILLTSVFINTLLLSCDLAYKIINRQVQQIYTNVIFILIQFLPLFLPCIYADGIHAEVTTLREILVSSLHGNILDKSNRSSARALLGLLETRDLTFYLFQMFNIDLTLPLKFMALLLTYLIIVLQFDKVMNS